MTTRPALLPARTAGPPAPESPEWHRLARRARALSWVSVVWMIAEGAIAIAAGRVAGSIALIGFGLDSAVEGLASVIVIWRFTGARLHSARSERRAQRLVGVTFFLLAPYIAVEAIRALAGGEQPETSWVGIGLAAASLIGMPLLAIAKERIGRRLGSEATRGEGAQNLLCAGLAAALLIGLLGNAAFGAWWLDPTVALLIAGLAIREGVEAWRGEGCRFEADHGPVSTEVRSV